jgi:hypothetical protein
VIVALELRRRSDEVIYRFERCVIDAQVTWRRSDRDLYLTWRPGFGWGAWDGNVLQGRPWDVPEALQTQDIPPEGLWVSQKGAKSYSYDLVHL